MSLRRSITILSLSLTACASALIPGTPIKDTPDNKAVMALLARYKNAFEARDPQAILALVDADYADAQEQLDRASLERELLGGDAAASGGRKGLFDHVREARLDIQVRRIEIDPRGSRAEAEVFFDTAYLFDTAFQNGADGKDPWNREADYKRMTLVKTSGGWKIHSGL